MLKAGAIILSIGSGLNLLLAAFILVIAVVYGEQARLLAVVHSNQGISSLGAKILLEIKSMAILFNSSIAAASLMALFIIWSGLIHGQKWAFWALLLSLGLVQFFGFTANSAIMFRTVYVNAILSALYVFGIGLAGYAIYSKRVIKTGSAAAID